VIDDFDSIFDLDDLDLRRLSPAQAAFLIQQLAAARALDALLHADRCSCDACRVRRRGEKKLRKEFAAGLRARLVRSGGRS
jgi:hypothetical protein